MRIENQIKKKKSKNEVLQIGLKWKKTRKRKQSAKQNKKKSITREKIKPKWSVSVAVGEEEATGIQWRDGG